MKIISSTIAMILFLAFFFNSVDATKETKSLNSYKDNTYSTDILLNVQRTGTNPVELGRVTWVPLY